MTLQSTTVPVLFDKGLEQKSNYKVAMIGSFLALQNVVRRKVSLWEKRYGQSIVGTFTGARSLAQFNDDLICADGSAIQTLNPTTNTFKTASGMAVPVSFSRQPVYRSGNGAGAQDCAYANGYTCVVFGESLSGANMATVFDTATGAVAMPPFFLHANTNAMANPPRVVGVGNYFLILFDENDTPNIHLCTINTATMTAVSGAALFTDGSACDVYPLSSTAIAIVYTNTSNGITVCAYDPAIGKGNGSNGLPAPVTIGNGATATANNALTCFVAFGFLYVFYAGSTTPNALKCTVISATTFVTQSTITIDATGAATQTPVTVAISDSTSHILTVLYATLATGVGTFGSTVMRSTVTWAGGTTFNVATPSVNAYNVTLYSRAFTASDGHVYCFYGYGGGGVPSQDCYYLARVDMLQNNQPVGYAVARFCSGTASAYPLRYDGIWPVYRLPSVAQDNQGRFAVSLRVATAATSTLSGLPGESNIAFGIDLYYLAVGTAAFSETNLGPCLQLTAGLVNQFDGTLVNELGFHTYPENFLTSTATTGGTLTGGLDYAFRVIYEWIGGQGDIQRSGPSIIKAVRTGLASGSGGTNTNTVTVNIPPPTFSGKSSLTSLRGCRGVVYVGYQGDATLFYRHGFVTFISPQLSGSRIGYTIDTEPDQTQEILYTTGGILENIAPPACNVAHVHKNRLWLGGLETSELWYSKEFSEGLGVAFSDVLVMPVEDDGGAVTALASLDDKLVIFKKDRLYFIVGNGPGDDGNSSDFSEPQRIPSDTGTVLPNTVITLPSGVLFKSPKGWYLLTRALTVAYIGDKVEDYNGNTACTATLLSDQNEVRLMHSNGDCIVYNYHFNDWSTFTNYQGYDSVVASGTYYRLGTDGKVWREIPGQYNDAGVTYSMTLETSWFQFRKIQGFQRIYDFELIGDFFSHHNLQVSVAYDFNSAYNQTISYNTQTNGITGPILQLRIQPKVQKCSAMKIKIVDVDNIVVGGGASFKPTALTFELAGKKGTLKLPGSRQIG